MFMTEHPLHPLRCEKIRMTPSLSLRDRRRSGHRPNRGGELN